MGRAALYSDGGFGSELVGLKVMEVNYIPSSRVIGAPVESGVVVFDTKVIDPARVVVIAEIEIGSTSGIAAKSAIKAMLNNTESEFYSASNGDDCYGNLILETYSEKRTAGKYDLLSYELTCKQAMVRHQTSAMTGDDSDYQDNGFTEGRSV